MKHLSIFLGKNISGSDLEKLYHLSLYDVSDQNTRESYSPRWMRCWIFQPDAVRSGIMSVLLLGALDETAGVNMAHLFRFVLVHAGLNPFWALLRSLRMSRSHFPCVRNCKEAAIGGQMMCCKTLVLIRSDRGSQIARIELPLNPDPSFSR